MKHYIRAKFKASVDVRFEFDPLTPGSYDKALKRVEEARIALATLGMIDKESFKLETAKE